MPQPTVSKHLRVLHEAGFVEATVDAQRPSLPDGSLNHFRRWMSGWLCSVGSGLLMWMLSNATPTAWNQSTPTKRKIRRKRRGPNRERDKGETT
jgi:hypothetical protein